LNIDTGGQRISWPLLSSPVIALVGN